MRLDSPQQQHLRSGEWGDQGCRKLLFLEGRGNHLNRFYVKSKQMNAIDKIIVTRQQYK